MFLPVELPENWTNEQARRIGVLFEESEQALVGQQQHLGVCLGHYRHRPAPPREQSLTETALVLESHHLHVGVPMHERDLRVGGDPREG